MKKNNIIIGIIVLIVIVFVATIALYSSRPTQDIISMNDSAITTSTSTSLESARSKVQADQGGVASNVNQTTQQSTSTTGYVVSVNKRSFNAELADNQATQELGLSNRDSLPQDRVMLFVFNQPWPWEIWMKDMRFSIDIFWLDKDMKVIYKQENVLPSSYPKTYAPKQNAWYVVETNSGFAAENRVVVGSQFTLSRATN